MAGLIAFVSLILATAIVALILAIRVLARERANPTSVAVNAMHDAMLVCDRDRKVRIVNPALCALVSATAEELIGKDAIDIAPGLDSTLPRGARDVETELRSSTGEMIPVSVTISAVEHSRTTAFVILARDIRETRRVEREMRETEIRLHTEEEKRRADERFRRMIENVLDVILLVDARGTLLYATPSIEPVLGYAPHAMIGQSLFGIVSAEETETMRNVIKMVHDEDLPARADFHIRHADGSTRLMESIARAMPDDRVVITCRDVTQQRQSEMELRASERQYRTVIESMRDGILQLDRDMRIVYANDRIYTLLGFSRQELLGQHLLDFVDPPELRALLRQKSELRRQGISESYRARLRTKNRQWKWVEISAAPVYDIAGNIVGSLGVIADVTERKESEDEQRRLQQEIVASAHEWQKTFDAIPSPILILDRSGSVRRMNQAAQGLIRSGDRAIGRRVIDLGSEHLWKEIGRLARSGADDTAQFRDEVTGKTWDLIVSTTGPADTDLLIAAARDISETVQMQESLRKSETMSAMGALVGGVAHEVRNPLFAISSTLDAFEDVFGAREEYQRFAAVMRAQLSRLTDLMSGLLELGRPPATEKRAVAIDPIVQEAIAINKHTADDAGVKIAYSGGAAVSVISADRQRLINAFRNLIENAVQFSPRGGTVEVETRTLDGLVQFAVRDRGPGFSDDDLPHLFEPFFTRRQNGTGLGLAIVQKVIDEHGGKVTVSNRPDGGAVIDVELPIARLRHIL